MESPPGSEPALNTDDTGSTVPDPVSTKEKSGPKQDINGGKAIVKKKARPKKKKVEIDDSAPKRIKETESDVDRKDASEWAEEDRKYERRGKIRRTISKVLIVVIVIIVISSVSIVYLYYETFDTDSDGVLDWDDDDDDGDGMPDDWEKKYGFDPLDDRDGKRDADADNLTNHEEYDHTTDPFDPDSDDDGLLDGDELPVRTDPLNPDSDDDGLPDGWEARYGLNPKNAMDAELDTDRDGFERKMTGLTIYVNYTNLQEFENNTNPVAPDTDSDGMYDGWELYYNSAVDSLKKFNEELNLSFDPLSAADGSADYDVDKGYNLVGDGLTNTQEFLNSTNPLKPDTDGDDLSDGLEVGTHGTDPNQWDSDSDLLPDGWEVSFALDPLAADSDSNSINDSREDKDADGLSNFLEYILGTNPYNNDTDSDGMTDGWEVDNDLDPLALDHQYDLDNDSLPNLLERKYGTDPRNPDTDNDTLSDGQEAVVGWHGVLVDGVFVTASWAPRYFTDPLNNDTDSDGLFDNDEVKGIYISNATNNDTDSDGLTDFDEVVIEGTDPSRADSDSDGLSDMDEIHGNYGYVTLPRRNDTDGDGISDGDEVFTDFYPGGAINGSNPVFGDTDGDGIPDGWEALYGKTSNYSLISRFDSEHGTNLLSIADVDNDKIVENPVWLVNPLDPDDADYDPDHDSYDINDDEKITGNEIYSSLREYEDYSAKYETQGLYTDPLDWDSDDDGMSDFWELYFSENQQPDPLDGTDWNLDLDNDFVKYYISGNPYFDDYTNLEEFNSGIDLDGDNIIDSGTTDPNDSDKDNDNVNDYEEIWFSDYDNDGLFTGWELLFNGTQVHAPNGYNPSFEGGLSIYYNQFNPYSSDSDSDGIPDGAEDIDGDIINNTAEHGSNPEVSPGSSDPTDSTSVRSISRSDDERGGSEWWMVEVAETSNSFGEMRTGCSWRSAGCGEKKGWRLFGYQLDREPNTDRSIVF